MTKERIATVLVSLAVCCLASCSNEAVYENLQIQQRNDCLKEPPGRYEECVERVNKSYEEYRREREEISSGATKQP